MRHEVYHSDLLETNYAHSVSAVAWSVVYSYGLLQTIELALLMILRDYLLVGIVIATLLWYVYSRDFALFVD